MNKTYVFFADGFEEIEAIGTVDILRRAGMDVTTVSVKDTHEVTGAHNVTIKADALLQDVTLDNAEWLILPGGMPGAENLHNCQPLQELLKAQNANGSLRWMESRGMLVRKRFGTFCWADTRTEHKVNINTNNSFLILVLLI